MADTLKTTSVPFNCDNCGTLLYIIPLAQILSNPRVMFNTMCEPCRDITGANDRDLAAWTQTLAHIPDMDGMEWDQWGPVERDDGPRWSDVIAPLFWVVCGVIVMYAVYGWIR